MGTIAKLALPHPLIHSGRSHQYPQFLPKGDRLSSTAGDRINGAIYPRRGSL
ncbi:MAG: hypothetical protein JGK26_13725 [Microcoleus sp. PH2017_27_LUM_O_A]|uniref:hypothetical protein n=1 Tax=Microcoleus sp. PH2017_27_LUM_O_A TaxID=2798837 RepID=UPI001DA78512|nr:hypothetical protein [Microcoleus sp. PH2017_27_LUM_O_A]MCC3479322.1 hypothetical protein [Microcoleus sp. PH2017_12_PCY_D_A]MCC3541370.1 hypothetical protein [Microcoleus sp. PH2017_22_RUC_O_B]MCC3560163.1 hypothetical protein [Microcoleus sp. PH2017_27_LUM_O_A]